MSSAKPVPTEVGYYWCRPFKSSTSSTVINVGLAADNYDCYEDEYPDELCIVTPQYDWMGLSDVYIWGPKIEEWVPDESVRS